MLTVSLHKKWSFPLRISSVNATKSAGNWDLVTFTEEIHNGKLHFCVLVTTTSYFNCSACLATLFAIDN